MSILTSAQLTFQDLKDSYHMQLSPDCIALNCNQNGATVADQTVDVKFGTYMGTNRVGTSTCNVSNLPSGVTVTSKTNATATADGTIKIKIAKDTTLQGSLTATFKISATTNDGDSFYFEKYVTLIKSVVGATGSAGKTYWINCDTSSIKRDYGGDYLPPNMNVVTMARSGDADAVQYPSYIKIEEGNDYVTSGGATHLSDSSAAPIKNMVIEGHSLQSGTPTPDSPAPITSVEEINIKVMGKNLLPMEPVYNLYGAYNATGTFQAGSGVISFICPVRKNTVYTVSKANTTNCLRVFGSIDFPHIGGVSNWIGQNDSGTAYSFNSGNNNFVCVVISTNNEITNTQLEVGSATAFEPYHEESCTITPPRPLNAIDGYVDNCNVEDGVWEYKTHRGGVETISVLTRSSAYTGSFYCSSTQIAPNAIPIGNQAIPKKCNVLLDIGRYSASSYKYGAMANDSYYNFYISNTAFVSNEAVKNYLAEIGFEWVYPLAEPIETPINSNDLALLKSLKTYAPETNISITDQDGNDISAMFSYKKNKLTYTQKYFSSTAESQVNYTPSSATIYDTTDGLSISSPYYNVYDENLIINNVTGNDGIKAIRLSMYDTVDATKLLDQQIIPIVSDGDVGAPGFSATVFTIYSADGDTFTDDITNITMQARAYDGANMISDSQCTYTWYKFENGDWIAAFIVDFSGQSIQYQECHTSSITISRSDVLNVQTYKCEMVYNGTTYEDFYTLTDRTDIYSSSIVTLNGTVLNASQPYTVAYVKLEKNGEEVDPLIGKIIDGGVPSESGVYYHVDQTNKAITLQYYDVSTNRWSTTNAKQLYQYNWYPFNNSNYATAFTPTASKVILIHSADITNTLLLECSIVNEQSIAAKTLSKCQMCFVDMNDPIVCAARTDIYAPDDNLGNIAKQGQLWVNTSTNPYTMNVYNGQEWEVIKAYNSNDVNIFTSKPDTMLEDDSGQCYHVGDMWVVGSDYQPNRYKKNGAQFEMITNSNGTPKTYAVNTILISIAESATYADQDWMDATGVSELRDRTDTIEEVMKIFDDGLYLFGKSLSDSNAKFYSRLSSGELGFWQREAGSVPNTKGEIESNRGTKVVWISNKELYAKETTIENSLKIIQPEDSSSLPFLQIGNLKIQQESDGSYSVLRS